MSSSGRGSAALPSGAAARARGLAGLAGLVCPQAPHAGDPADIAEGWNHPALGTGQATTTGHRALDTAFATGRILTPHRLPLSSAAAVDTEGQDALLQPAVDRYVVTPMLAEDAPQDASWANPDTAPAGPIIPIASRRSYVVPVPGPNLFSIPMTDRQAAAIARQLQDMLRQLHSRVAEVTGDVLKVVEGDIQAVTDELLSLEYRNQLKSNTLSLLSTVQPNLKSSLNQPPRKSKLEVLHTVPYADPGARKARELLQKWGLSIHDPADAVIVPASYHRGENIHGMADKGYNPMVVKWLEDADKDATEAEVEGGREEGRMVMLDAVRALSDQLVAVLARPVGDLSGADAADAGTAAAAA